MKLPAREAFLSGAALCDLAADRGESEWCADPHDPIGRFRADARGPGRSPASAPGAPLSGNPLIAPVGQRFGETHGSFAAPTAAIYAVEPVQHFGVALDDEISLINRSTT